MKIPAYRLDPELPLPGHAHPGDAGVDLYARTGHRIEPEEWAMVPTGLVVAIPEGHVGLVAPRSGLAARHGIGVVNGPGVVDAGYRGEIQVVLINHSATPFEFDRGERIAQLVVVPVVEQELEEVDELPSSRRSSGGFGSTGR